MDSDEMSFLRDVGFVTAAAENWAELLVRMQDRTFATNAKEYQANINAACVRVRQYVKEGR